MASRQMRKRSLFAITFAVTLTASLLALYLNRPKPPAKNILTRVTDQVFITSQLSPEDIAKVTRAGMKTIIDIRPDGEATDQTPSSEIGAASRAQGLSFHYIPVPHETIPDNAVNTLASALATTQRPALLYCRTGRRAVRLFALTEASRTGGPASEAIHQMVQAAGFSADDLRDEIARRIGKRNAPTTPN